MRSQLMYSMMSIYIIQYHTLESWEQTPPVLPSKELAMWADDCINNLELGDYSVIYVYQVILLYIFKYVNLYLSIIPQ